MPPLFRQVWFDLGSRSSCRKSSPGNLLRSFASNPKRRINLIRYSFPRGLYSLTYGCEMSCFANHARTRWSTSSMCGSCLMGWPSSG